MKMDKAEQSLDSLFLAKSSYNQRHLGLDHERLARLSAFSFEAHHITAQSTSMIHPQLQHTAPVPDVKSSRCDDDAEAMSLEGYAYDAGDEKKSDWNIVRWNGADDPENPQNWSKNRKWIATILVSLFAFLSPFASTMVTPALDVIGDQYMIAPGFSRQLVMSIFLFGFAIGPFTFAPLSEIYGRVRVLQYANLIFLVFNTACPFAQSKEAIYTLRLLSGVGASAPQALGSGVIADCWSKDERGKGQAIYGTVTFIGPCLAPIMGAFIVGRLYWGWIFWITSLLNVVVQLLAVLFLRETLKEKILGDRAKRLRMETGNPDLRTEFDNPEGGSKITGRRLALPFIMMFTHPAVQIPSLFRAVLYGMMYTVLSTFQQVWTRNYQMTKEIASLNYLSLAIGFIIGLQISQILIDKLYAYLKNRKNVEEGLPEWRIPPMLLGGLIAPAGLVLYGWSAYLKFLWVVPDIGAGVFTLGLVLAFQSAQAYVTDAYGARHAASAAAGGAFMRTMAGFGFPLFAPAMYDALGLGVGNTVLAGSTLVLMLLGPVVMWFYGAKLRAWSTTGLD